MINELSVVMLGATGAVGSQAAGVLAKMPKLSRLSLLGRRPLDGLSCHGLEQHKINIFEPEGYRGLLSGHRVAICTLGVGQPSKMSKADFLKIDKQAVLDFARECKLAGVEHFQLLGSMASSPKSRSFYLRAKGQLEKELEAMEFSRLSIFQPSMILTPVNRYGWLQGLTLKVWPWLDFLLIGPLRNYRGIRVEELGQAIAVNCITERVGVERLRWRDFKSLARPERTAVS